MAGTEERLAKIGITRAPGETDDEYVERAAATISGTRHGYGTVAWWSGLTFAQSWWICHVEVWSPAPCEVRVKPRGPLRTPLPRRLRKRLYAKLRAEAPINVRLELC